MSTPFDDLRAQIEALCRRYHVQRLDLFGSAATSAFDPAHSDVDLLVDFASDAHGQTLDAYFGLKESLEALFGRPVDLVILGAVRNPYVRADIERNRQPLYAA